MPLQSRALAFDDPDWVFELKYDGFPGAANSSSHQRNLISSLQSNTQMRKKGHEFNEQALLTFAKSYLLEAFPNRERIDCPVHFRTTAC